MNRYIFSAIVTCGMGLMANSWAQAVAVDASSLVSRLDAIESRLSAAEARRTTAAPPDWCEWCGVYSW